MLKHLLPQVDRQFKANLHTHTTFSDGKLTPEETKAAYKAKGFQILCLTDHELCVDHSYMNEEDFLMLTGYEIGGINSQPWNRRSKTYHFCMIAKDPKNTWQVYRIPNIPEHVKPFITCDDCDDFPLTYSFENINAMIAKANQKGFLVTYNHAIWSMQSYPDYMPLEGLWAMEIFNTTCCLSGHDDYNDKVYQDFLWAGKFLNPVAADDMHGPHHLGFGWVMVAAPKLEYGCVIDALEQGDFYASTGPEIHSLTVDGTTLKVTCSDADRITLNSQYRFAKLVRSSAEGPLHEAEFDISLWLNDITEEERKEDRAFLRVTVTDPAGNQAYTRAYRYSEITK